MSSSSAALGIPGSDLIHADFVELKLRGSSQSRSSSLIPGHIQIGSQAEGLSPALQSLSSEYQPSSCCSEPARRRCKTRIPAVITSTAGAREILIHCYRYARMQWQSLPSASHFTFDVVVPQGASTRHVAAAALYHCLVLATKDLLRLEQPNPYGPLYITIK